MLTSLLPYSYAPSPTYETLMHTFWPGPLTLLLPARVPKTVTADHPTVAMHMPARSSRPRAQHSPRIVPTRRGSQGTYSTCITDKLKTRSSPEAVTVARVGGWVIRVIHAQAEVFTEHPSGSNPSRQYHTSGILVLYPAPPMNTRTRHQPRSFGNLPLLW